MIKKHNIYDSGYKKLFSNHEFLRQLLTGFVNEEWVFDIDYSTLERVDKSFISDDFIERESDLIYKVKFKGKDIFVFILLEFQSTVDRFMSLRMLHYIVELYEYLVRNHKLRNLPAVFPVMLYNGEKRWTAPEELNILIEKSIPERYIPGFRYYKIAENEFSREFLTGINNTVAALFYTENCSGEDLQREIDSIVNLMKTEKPEVMELFVIWFRYMFQDKNEIVEEIRGIEEVKSMLRTSIKKYGEQLARESKLEGKLEGKLETAGNLLKERMSIKKISRITGLPEEEIKKLKS